PRLEKLGYPGKTTGNVTRLAHSPGDLRQHLARFDLLVRIHRKVSAHRNIIGLRIGFSVYNDGRILRLVAGFSDHLLAVTGLLIRLFLKGYTLDDRFIFYSPVKLGKDYGVVRIPETKFVSLLNLLPIGYPQE